MKYFSRMTEREQQSEFEYGNKKLFLTANPKINIKKPFMTAGPSWSKTNDKTGEVEEEGPLNKIYFDKENKDKALELKKLLLSRDRINRKAYHTRVGRLLGYNDYEIGSFLKNRG